MKKLFLIAIAAIAFTTASQAQTDSSFHKKMKGEHGANMQHNKNQMWNDLNLTQDQKDQMKKLHEDNKTKMDALKNNTALSDDQRKEQMKTLRDEQRKSMESVLTDEQKAKMKEMRSEKRNERKQWKMNKDSTGTQK